MVTLSKPESLLKKASSLFTLSKARSSGMLIHSTVQLNMMGLLDLRARTWLEFWTTWAFVTSRRPATTKPVPDHESWVLRLHGSL
jgi:hypothetical protein